MSQCAGIKADGGRCHAQAIADSQWCFSHHPDYEEQRRRRASKGGKRGGRGRPVAEVAEIKDAVRGVIDGVEGGALDRNDAAVMLQGYRALKDLVELERRVKETADLAREIEELKRETS